MIQKLLNVFRIPDLRNKLLFTVAMLCVYRIGFYVALPGVDAPYLRVQHGSTGAFEMLANYVSMFSGGDLAQGTLFGLGIMPYISASIIIQLLGTVMPVLEKMKKEGEPGIRKINEWTRYLTVGVCIFQASFYIYHFSSDNSSLYSAARAGPMEMKLFMVGGVIMLTAGSVFLMWLGEQIEQFGIGNGVSLIITAGIVSRMPVMAQKVLSNVMSNPTKDAMGWNWDFISKYMHDLFDIGGDRVNILVILFLVACFVFVVGASIYLTQAQRRIPVQQAKHMRGRRVYGGSKQYLPLRVNHSGVMPIIFASTLVSLPLMGLQKLIDLQGGAVNWWTMTLRVIEENINSNSIQGLFLYELGYCAMIFFFSYFWNTVQFQPKEMANQLRDYGSFIPGLRPGKRTADYLENVMGRITYVGAAFLCVIAIIPSIVAWAFLRNSLGQQDAFQVAQFLGGTGLLIIISVMLDFVNRIEANLIMRNYGGFLEDDGEGPSKIKRPKGGARGPTPPPRDSETPRGLPA